MIVVVGRVQTDAGRRAELVRIGQVVAAASRLERGCISYRLYEDTENENEFVFVEEWDSDDDALRVDLRLLRTLPCSCKRSQPRSSRLRMSSSTASRARWASPT